MLKVPKKDDKTLEFERLNSERKAEISKLYFLADEGKFDLEEYKAIATRYNEELVSFGGKGGFSTFSLLPPSYLSREKAILHILGLTEKNK